MRNKTGLVRPVAQLGVLFTGLGLVGGMVLWLHQPSQSQDAAPPTLKRSAIPAQGILEPLGKVLDITSSNVDRVDALLVKEGDVVEAGAILLRLESHAVRKAQRDLAEHSLKEARSQLASATALGEARVHQAELHVKHVEKVNRLGIDIQQTLVARHEAILETKRTDRARVRHLFAKDIAKQKELDRAELEVKQITQDLASARILVTQMQAAWKSELTKARAAEKTARADLVAAQNQIKIKSLEAELQLADARLKPTLILAPTKGKVLRILARVGEAATPGLPLLEFGDPTDMTALAEVYESDMGQIALGMRATVTSPALEGELAGVVDRVGTTVRRNRFANLDPAADSDTRVVEVRVRLDKSELAARFLNLHVDVRILLGDAGSAGATPRTPR